MKKVLFSREELLAQTDTPDSTLQEWERQKLIGVDGLTESKVPFYSRITLQKILHIKSLLALGYRIPDIQKIFKKVGLPEDSHPGDAPKKPTEFLTVGALAERVGVSPRTLKHWEEKGIIDSDMRSEGGFRLYPDAYVYLCDLIKDLQLFGFSLDEIKAISDQFRDFMAIKENILGFTPEKTLGKLDAMLSDIDAFHRKMDLFKEGIARWEELLKNKKKEILALKRQNEKAQKGTPGHA